MIDPRSANSSGWTSALFVFGVLTAVLLWPQVSHVKTWIAAHQDSLFSIWRLAWISHQLPRHPLHLFDANNFYPNRNTLAYSDPVLLQGLIGAPFIWAGVANATVYNCLVIGSFVMAGLSTFVLARELNIGTLGSIAAGVIYAFSPFRFAHFFHLELLWGYWIPLTLVFVHRAFSRGAIRNGVLAGACFSLQIASCLYYAIFFAVALSLIVPLLFLTSSPSRWGRSLLALLPALIVVLAVGWIYSRPFLTAYADLGDRDIGEIIRYSATWRAYIATPASSYLYGWTAIRFGGPELSLFPGLLPAALVVIALVPPFSRQRAIYAAALALAVWASFGLHSGLYHVLYSTFLPFRGLRAPARFGVLTSLFIAILAGFGLERIRWPGTWVTLARVMAIPILLIELASKPSLMQIPSTPAVYGMLRTMPTGPVAELPMPLPDALPGSDPSHEYHSTAHWFPLVNGYSGYYPPSYLRLLEQFRSFPSGNWLERLAAARTEYIVLHEADLSPQQTVKTLLQLSQTPNTSLYGPFAAAGGRDWLCTLNAAAK